jgi:hypothetical protein
VLFLNVFVSPTSDACAEKRGFSPQRSNISCLRQSKSRCVIMSRRRLTGRKQDSPAATPEAEEKVMSSFTAIVSILAAAAAVTFAITAYVN